MGHIRLRVLSYSILTFFVFECSLLFANPQVQGQGENELQREQRTHSEKNIEPKSQSESHTCSIDIRNPEEQHCLSDGTTFSTKYSDSGYIMLMVDLNLQGEGNTGQMLVVTFRSDTGENSISESRIIAQRGRGRVALSYSSPYPDLLGVEITFSKTRGNGTEPIINPSRTNIEWIAATFTSMDGGNLLEMSLDGVQHTQRLLNGKGVTLKGQDIGVLKNSFLDSHSITLQAERNCELVVGIAPTDYSGKYDYSAAGGFERSSIPVQLAVPMKWPLDLNTIDDKIRPLTYNFTKAVPLTGGELLQKLLFLDYVGSSLACLLKLSKLSVGERLVAGAAGFLAFLPGGMMAASIPLRTAEDLQRIGQNGQPLNGNYTLKENINARGLHPVGSVDQPFTGQFDGEGHSVVGQNNCLFTEVAGDAVVANTHFDQPNINALNTAGAAACTAGGNSMMTGIRVTGGAVRTTGRFNEAGAVVGELKGNAQVIAPHVQRVEVSTTGSSADAGGVAGQTLTSSSIVRPVVKHSNISTEGRGGDVGGVVGHMGGGAELDMRGGGASDHNTLQASGNSSHAGGLVGRVGGDDVHVNGQLGCDNTVRAEGSLSASGSVVGYAKNASSLASPSSCDQRAGALPVIGYSSGGKAPMQKECLQVCSVLEDSAVASGVSGGEIAAGVLGFGAVGYFMGSYGYDYCKGNFRNKKGWEIAVSPVIRLRDGVKWVYSAASSRCSKKEEADKSSVRSEEESLQESGSLGSP